MFAMISSVQETGKDHYGQLPTNLADGPRLPVQRIGNGERSLQTVFNSIHLAPMPDYYVNTVSDMESTPESYSLNLQGADLKRQWQINCGLMQITSGHAVHMPNMMEFRQQQAGHNAANFEGIGQGIVTPQISFKEDARSMIDTDHSNSFIPIRRYISSRGCDGGKMLGAVTSGLHPNQLPFADIYPASFRNFDHVPHNYFGMEASRFNPLPQADFVQTMNGLEMQGNGNKFSKQLFRAYNSSDSTQTRHIYSELQSSKSLYDCTSGYHLFIHTSALLD
ncbi:hypothetical protein GYMLUDRAFT_55560 [Collybiopsis luxurians FD-317 M1]|nr:hypothetical protein GYMLUDRAFT_55560 [Collybiopsis luxurians FD-317 M1]